MTGASVTARTAHEVATLYQRLWNSSPPLATDEQQAAAAAARAHAVAQGWLPPLAWDDIESDPITPPSIMSPGRDDIDEIAVERALAGDGMVYDDLTSAEQQEVVRRLTARGRSIRDIATQLATTKRTVSRRRASLGVA
jgi:DNA-binding NarL/FixJ family response regulator